MLRQHLHRAPTFVRTTIVSLAVIVFSIASADFVRAMTCESLFSSYGDVPKPFRHFVYATMDLNHLAVMANARRVYPKLSNYRTPGLSVSLIDQNHSNTFTASGVILSGGPKRVLAASPRDLVRQHRNFSISALDSKYIDDLASLLRETKSGPPKSAMDWNEILLAEDSARPGFEIDGFFIRTDSLGNALISDEHVSAILKMSRTSGLPLHTIKPSTGFYTIALKLEYSKNEKFLRVLATKNEFLDLQSKAKRAGQPLFGEWVERLGIYPHTVDGYFDGLTYRAESYDQFTGEVISVNLWKSKNLKFNEAQ